MTRIVLTSLLFVAISPYAVLAQQTLAPAEGARRGLAEGGRALATIVLPAQADELEVFAADELRRYVKAAAGAELPVVREPQQPEGYGVWIGRTSAAASAKFALTDGKLGRDGYAAESDDQRLTVVGRCPLGTLFGVYDLVEREFGVRWCEPDELGEVVPRAASLSVGTFRREFKPSFDYRWVDTGDWALKQRMNVQVAVNKKPVGVNWLWHFHTFAILIPPEKYFDKHPDWFPLVNGKRQKSTREHSDSTQLCTSNPEVVDKLASGLLEALDADPSIEIITLSPNDGGGFCECPRCTALDGPGRGWFARYSKRLAILNREIAKRVGRRYPHVRIKVGAYAMYAQLPEIENYRPEPNLLFQLCHIYFCHNHPVASGLCRAGETYQPSGEFLPNQEFSQLLQRWRAVTDELFIYEYYSLGGWSRENMLWPMVHTMRRDIPWYREMGVRGFYTQIGPWIRAPLNYYIAAKLAWNADLDVDWLIDDFCDKFFENAAEPMRGYLLEIEQAMVRNNQCISYGLRSSRAKTLGPEIFNRPTLDKLRSYLDEARRRANTDAVRRRIAAVRVGFDDCAASVSAKN